LQRRSLRVIFYLAGCSVIAVRIVVRRFFSSPFPELLTDPFPLSDPLSPVPAPSLYCREPKSGLCENTSVSSTGFSLRSTCTSNELKFEPFGRSFALL
jgi:hypothetical protein